MNYFQLNHGKTPMEHSFLQFGLSLTRSALYNCVLELPFAFPKLIPSSLKSVTFVIVSVEHILQ